MTLHTWLATERSFEDLHAVRAYVVDKVGQPYRFRDAVKTSSALSPEIPVGPKVNRISSVGGTKGTKSGDS